MNKIKKVCFILFIIFLVSLVTMMSGCSKNASKEEVDYSSGVVPNLMSIGEPTTGAGLEYYYTIDKNTGVVYLSCDGYRRHAITVMLNADGSPVTAEQLGINY